MPGKFSLPHYKQLHTLGHFSENVSSTPFAFSAQVESMFWNPAELFTYFQSAHRVQICLVFLQFSSKLLKSFFGESCLISAFTIFFGSRMIKRSFIFQTLHSCKKVCSQMLTIKGKRKQFVRSFKKKKFGKFG